MDNSTVYILLIVIFGLIVTTLVTVRNGFSGLKLMLLGISIILCGGIIALSPKTNYVGGIVYLIICIGLIISFIGLWKKD
ncbi:hypothetical protein [Clostridium estertheticum]|uniref:hypothetical protein n=1 Tax=Clostridium estertheticum TaxID=238834 RepID=UPI001C7DF791|nr:hypothetical protein [Clostridium estertheticum]MBX4264396.1 hypothetical protein [Clostridium estertheticum]MBX4267978.1 hypothetical protein [Clostridium estertheticum]WLC78206.1 hypothetical protein KTC98_13270 [Clostridium estertheticum]WLC89238.1 hypothetical protein KTC95_03135 [Clostridium estertheticum]